MAVSQTSDGKFKFSCDGPGCDKEEGGFDSKLDAQIAYRLHQIGCKKS